MATAEELRRDPTIPRHGGEFWAVVAHLEEEEDGEGAKAGTWRDGDRCRKSSRAGLGREGGRHRGNRKIRQGGKRERSKNEERK